MKTIKLELTDAERKAIKLLLFAEYRKYVDRVGHAASHGDEYSDPFGNAVETVIDKIERAEDAEG